MRDPNLEFIMLVARLQRENQEIIKARLENEQIRDLNPAQAIILMNIRQKETSVGSLIERGYYAGSNVSYNVKKMLERGYVEQRVSESDRRSLLVRPSEKGMKICDLLARALSGASDYEILAKNLESSLREALEELEKIKIDWRKTGS